MRGISNREALQSADWFTLSALGWRMHLASVITSTREIAGHWPANEERTMNRALVVCLIAVLSAGCASAPPQPVDQRSNALTQGNVQLNLRVGVTNKAQVLEVFGAPNITTRDASGAEVWSYQRHATVAQSNSSSGYWTILLAGGGSTAEGFSQTSRTVTLIIKFDSRDVVSDFRSRTSEF